MQSIKLKNRALAQIADDCGLVIEPNNPEVTDKEIEFFAESIVRACIEAVRQTPRHAAYTTFDLGTVEATIYAAEKQLIEKFKL